MHVIMYTTQCILCSVIDFDKLLLHLVHYCTPQRIFKIAKIVSLLKWDISKDLLDFSIQINWWFLKQNMTMSMITSLYFSRSSKEEIRQKLNAIAESTSHEDILSKVEQIHRAYNCWKLLPNTQNTQNKSIATLQSFFKKLCGFVTCFCNLKD